MPYEVDRLAFKRKDLPVLLQPHQHPIGVDEDPEFGTVYIYVKRWVDGKEGK